MTRDNGYEVEGQLQFVVDAVLAFAYAIESMQKQLCTNERGVCNRMLSADGSQLLHHLKTIRFKGLCFYFYIIFFFFYLVRSVCVCTVIVSNEWSIG